MGVYDGAIQTLFPLVLPQVPKDSTRLYRSDEEILNWPDPGKFFSGSAYHRFITTDNRRA